jgi:hypothetical protein
VALLVNVLGTLTVTLCAVLLLRAWTQTRSRLLLWSGACFVGLAISNLMLIVDLFVVPEISLHLLRLGVAAVAMLALVYGLVFESD